MSNIQISIWLYAYLLIDAELRKGMEYYLWASKDLLMIASKGNIYGPLAVWVPHKILIIIVQWLIA